MRLKNCFRTIGLFPYGGKIGHDSGRRQNGVLSGKGADSFSCARVKIIELDYKRCEYLCEALPEAVVIHGDGTDKETLQEEGLEKTDALVCLTGMDEEYRSCALCQGEKGFQDCENQPYFPQR